VNVNLNFSGAVTGQTTQTAFCILFLDVDTTSSQNFQHIDCATVSPFTIGKNQYNFSWSIYHYMNPGKYGGNGDVNAIMPQLQSKPLLEWSGSTAPADNTALINDDKLSGSLNARMIQTNTDEGVTPSAVTVSGTWTVQAKSCRNTHSLHFCP
jgi:hypothetical protein